MNLHIAAITKRTPNIVTLVGLCLIRSLLLLLLIMVICMYILYNRTPKIYGFLQIVPQCSIACERYMIELNTLSTLTASIIYFKFKDWKKGFSFKSQSVKEHLEFKRTKVIDSIEKRIDDWRAALIVGPGGYSKTTNFL